MFSTKNIKKEATDFWKKNKSYIIAAVIVLIALLVLVCWLCRKYKKNDKKKKQKKVERLKIRRPTPKKKLAKIQPDKNEIKVMEDLGHLRFILRYDPVSQALMTTVVEAEEVPIRDLSGYAYSYVAVTCLRSPESEAKEFKTKFVRASFWPEFNETIEIPVTGKDLEKQTLHLCLFEMNRWAQREGIAQIFVSLSGLGLNVGKERMMRMKLKPYKPINTEVGEVKLNIRYDPKWQLTIEVKECSLNIFENVSDNEDLYLSITVLKTDENTNKTEVIEKQRTKKSKLSSDTKEAGFKEKITFLVPDSLLVSISLRIALKAKRIVGKNILLGSFVIHPNSNVWKTLLDKSTVQNSFPLCKDLSNLNDL